MGEREHKKGTVGQVVREPREYEEVAAGVRVAACVDENGEAYAMMAGSGYTLENVNDLIIALMRVRSAMDGYVPQPSPLPQDGELIACAPLCMTVEQHEVEEVKHWVEGDLPEGWDEDAEAVKRVEELRGIMHMVRGWGEAADYTARMEHGFYVEAFKRLRALERDLGVAAGLIEGEGVPSEIDCGDDVPEGYVRIRLDLGEDKYTAPLMRHEAYAKVPPQVWTAGERIEVKVRNVVEPYMGKRKIVTTQEIVEVMP